MTLDEAITRYKSNAEYEREHGSPVYLKSEQLCKWLKELKKLREQEPILDKVRAEIEQLRLHKAQFITGDNKVCIDSQEVLNVIDKYTTESEGTDADSN